MNRLLRLVPELCAIALVALNAIKPVVVDDTAYLLHARHLALHPESPYGFEIFWNDVPQPATTLLLPPLLPYWLSFGMVLFGEDLLLLKLWLLPFAWLLARSVHALLRRFARGSENYVTVLIVLSPLVLPMFNFMLDVPALALGLACVAVTAEALAAERTRWSLVGWAALLGASAAQTKYTMLPLPAVVLWYGLTRGRLRPAIVLVAVGVLLFATWEIWVCRSYGESHFLHHFQRQGAAKPEVHGMLDRAAELVSEKFNLVQPLACHLGGLAIPFSLYAVYGLGLPRRLIAVIAAASSAGYAAVCFVPGTQAVLLRSSSTGSPIATLPMVVFSVLGWSFLATIAVSACMLVVRRRGVVFRIRRSSDSWFLAGWWLLELFAYLLLTPFPAGRRVILVGIVGGFVAVRFARLRRIRSKSIPMFFGLAVCLGLWSIDSFDACAEPATARAATERIARERPTGSTWTQGHWGWQWYGERLGMKTIVPGRTKMMPGDFLVLAVEPYPDAFYRPYHGESYFEWDKDSYDFLERIETTDEFPAITIPTLYGGKFPVVGRSHPRLTVDIHLVKREVDTKFDYRR